MSLQEEDTDKSKLLWVCGAQMVKHCGKAESLVFIPSMVENSGKKVFFEKQHYHLFISSFI